MFQPSSQEQGLVVSSMQWTLLLGVLIGLGGQLRMSSAQTCYMLEVTYESVLFTSVGYQSQAYYQSCGFLGWDTCTKYKIVSETVYQTQPQALYSSVAVCCAGYVGTHPDCTPVCDSPSCVNGFCQSPNTCQCYAGWSGSDCSSPICTSGCLNGVCTAPETCVCDSGFTGSFCSEDIDECLAGTDNCFSFDNCINNYGGFTCSCPSGYTLDSNGFTCTDIDECATNNGGCDYDCANSIGSYTCSCAEGFFLEANMHTCLDHDECSSSENNCEQLCLNHDGYFDCDCHPGCQLQQDNITCNDIDECLTGNGGCDQQCTDLHCSNGKYSCSCNDGYSLQLDGHACKDDDECTNNNGGCDQICTNFPGSYECSCLVGYVLDGDGFSCIALPCPVLVDPNNGVLSCTGQQVTNESCTIDCDPGYQPSTAATVDCLPSGSWSHEIASCPAKLCDELEPEDNARIVVPCYREFGSTCMQVCVEGYYPDGGTTIEQTCALLSVDEVDWTSPGKCQEILPCQPNPCEHGGECSASNHDTPICDCPSAYTGDYCEMLVVRFPPFPILSLNVTSSFTIHASPDSVLNIEILTSASIEVSPSHSLQIFPGESNVTFDFTPQLGGTFYVSYALQMADSKAMFETSVVSAVDTDSLDNYFDSFGLQSGIVGIGCCLLESSEIESLCPSLPPRQLSLLSSCSWVGSDDDSSFATSGVTFIASGGLRLPLSIAGIEGVVEDELNTNLANASIMCGSCSTNPSSQADCYRYDATPGYVRDMISSNSLLQTFLSAVQILLPREASIKQNIVNEVKAAYQPFDYQAIVTSASGSSLPAGCQTLNLPDGMYYALRTTTPLNIALATNSLILTSSEPVCFAVNICEGSFSSIIMSVGEDSKDVLSSASYLEDFYNAGFDVFVESIELSAHGLDLLTETGFWNGSGHYQPHIPSYDLGIQVHLRGIFGTVVATSLQFNGAVSTSVTESPIVSRLHGSFQLSLNVTSLNSTIVFQSEDEDGIFTSSESVVSGDGLFQHGWSQRNLKLSSVQPLPITGLFAQVINIPHTDFSSCLFDAYTILDDLLEVKMTSFISSCVVLHIGNLDFGNMEHSFFISRASSDKASMTVSSNPKEFPLSLGKFIVMEDVDDSKDGMFLSFSEEGLPFGNLSMARVTIFDARVLTTIAISDNQLSFKENVTIFEHYKFEIAGKLPTLDLWESQQLHLQGEANNNGNNFLQDFNYYIHSVIDSRVSHTNERIAKATEKVEQASDGVQVAAAKLSNVSLDYTERLSEYSLALESAEYFSALSQSNATAYQTALSAFNTTENLISQVETICSLQDCEQLCIPESRTEVCYRQFTLAFPDTCIQNEAVDVISVQATPYLSHMCVDQEVCRDHRGITWAVSSYASEDANNSVNVLHPLSWKDQLCYQNCIPVSTTMYQYQHIVSKGQETINYVCNGSVQSSSVPSPCVSSSLCVGYASHSDCTKANSECLSVRNETLIAGLEASQQEMLELNNLYASYQASLEEAAMAQFLVDSARESLSFSEQILKLVELQYNESVVAYDVSLLSSERVVSSLQDNLLLVQWLENYLTSDNLIQVTNISFDILMDSDLISRFPVLVTYLMPYSGVTEHMTIFVDFSAPFEMVRDLIASEITQHALETVAMETTTAQPGRRRSLTKRQTEEPTTNTVQRFENNCNYLQELMAYYAQVYATIQQGHNETIQFETTITSTISQLESVISAIDSESTPLPDAELAYYNMLLYQYNQLLPAASAAELLLWRSRMDRLHNSTASLVEFPCFSFSDCQRITISVLFNILEDTPLEIAGSKLADLSEVDSSLSVLTSSDNISYADAVSIITSTFRFIESIRDTGHWCARPPTITIHPNPQESVELGESLVLRCEGQSVLPLFYSWIKDNVTLSSATLRTLTIIDFSQHHAGTYVCVVTNAIASRWSTPSVVSFHQHPIISQQPSDVATYLGDENGVLFSCQAEAYPVLQWIWFHQPLGSTIWVNVGNASNVLVVDTPYHEQEGLYRCTADNSLDFGEETSQPASLVLLPFTVTRVKYLVEFVIVPTDLSVTTENVMDIVGSSLTSKISFNMSVIQTISFDPFDSTFKVSLSLLSANVTTATTMHSTLMSISKDLTNSLTNLELGLALVQVLLKDSNSSLVTTLSNSFLELDPTDIYVSHREYLCPEGQSLHDNYILCVSCAPGHYWNGYVTRTREIEVGSLVQENVSQCSSCSHGYYQSDIGAQQCQQCPKYYSTLSQGAKSLDECQELCSPNMYSSSGFVPCLLCDPGTYQPLYGSTHCFVCPQDSNDEHCSKQEQRLSSADVAMSPSASPLATTSLFYLTTIMIGVVAGLIPCIIFFILGVCILCIYSNRKKKKERIDSSKEANWYEYIGIKQRGIEGAVAFNTPPDSMDLCNNPMYATSAKLPEKEIYTELANDIYEDTSGVDLTVGVVPGKFSVNVAVADVDHTYEVLPPYLDVRPPNSDTA